LATDTLTPLRGLGINSANARDEYLIFLNNGACFYTSGWESLETLKLSVESGDDIVGAFAVGSVVSLKVLILPSQVTAYIDLRENMEPTND
jgi:hypothetical protein